MLDSTENNNNPGKEDSTDTSVNQAVKAADVGSDPSTTSNASNYNSLGYQVDPRTGSLQISISPPALSGFFGSSITPAIRYAQQSVTSGLQMLGLPLGWNFQFSFIYAGRIFINGQSSYFIDPNYNSGMRYYTLKNATFASCDSTPFYNSSLNYTSTLSFVSGETQYFDDNGRLIGMDDRFGNHVIFYYDTDDTVYNSKLVKIVDSYGQFTTFAYTSQGVTVSYPQKGKNSISFQYLMDSDSYLTGYVDPLGHQTNFTNDGGLNNNLVSAIVHPNGLTVKYTYSSLPYHDQSPNTQYLDCIASVQEISGSQTRTIQYSYDPLQDFHNFMGYPDFTTYSSLPGTDNLLTNPTATLYQYSTRVNDGLFITQHLYNHLHLELETQVFTATTPSPILTTHTINTYEGQDSDGSFPDYVTLISQYPNYQTPKTVTSNTYNNSGQMRTHQVSTIFNDYGNPTQVCIFQTDLTTNQLVQVSQENTTYATYTTQYGQVLQKDSSDYTGSASNPEIRRVLNTLTSDNKSIATSTNGLVVASTFQPSKQSTYTYDSSGRVTSQTFAWADGKSHAVPSTQATTAYTPASPVLTVVNTDAHDNSNTSHIDTTTGWVTNQVDALNNTVAYTYDNMGRKLTETDPMGVVTTWVYDDINNKVTTKYANGYQTYLYTDRFGQEIKTSDNMGPSGSERVLSTKAYNNLGQLIQEQGILGANSTITYTYDNRGNLATATDTLGNVTSYAYDSVAQTQTTFFNGNKVSEVTTNLTVTTGQSYSATDPTQTISTTTSSNAYNKATSSLLGNKTSSSWFETNYTYDADLNPAGSSTNAADGIIAARSYNRDLFANSLLDSISVTYPHQTPLSTTSDSFVYNILNQLTTETNALNQSSSCGYDAVGNQETYTDYAGITFTSQYNANGQVTSVSWMDGGGMYEKQFTYDDHTTHQLLSITDSVNSINQGTVSYTYTLDGKLSSLTYPDGKKISFTYDTQTDLLSQFTDALGNVTQYGYDIYGRLAQAQVMGTDYKVNLAYYTKAQDPNNSGKLQSITTNNGVVKSYTYDGFGSTSTLTVTDTTLSSNNVLLNMVYSYDPTTRNVVKIAYTSTASPTNANLNYTVEYTYNSLNQLVKEQTFTPTGTLLSTIGYTYDAANNVLTEMTTEGSNPETTLAYTYDADNKLITIQSSTETRTLKYDANGNLIDDGAGSTFTYDAKNNLTGYQNKTNNVQATYTYYPDGTRATKSTTDSDLIQFYYDGSSTPNIVNEVQAKTNTSTSYLMLGSTRYVRLVQAAGQTTPQYFIDNAKDTLGTLNSSNTFGDTYVYDPYGQETDSSSQHVPLTLTDNPFRYTGEYADAESSLIYLRARYYNPNIKHFMSRDTATLVNRYVYADGNPIMNIDPTGHSSVGSAIGAILGGIAAIAVGVIITVATAGTASPIAAGMIAGAFMGFGLSSTIYGASHTSNFNAGDYGIMAGAGAAFGAAGGGIGSGIGSAGWSAGRTLAADVAANTALGGVDGYVTNGLMNVNHHENFNQGWGPSLGMGLAGGFGSSLLLGGLGRGLAGRNGAILRDNPNSLVSVRVMSDACPHTVLRVGARTFHQGVEGDVELTDLARYTFTRRDNAIGLGQADGDAIMEEWFTAQQNQALNLNLPDEVLYRPNPLKEISVSINHARARIYLDNFNPQWRRYNFFTNSCATNVADGLTTMGFNVPIFARTPWLLGRWFRGLRFSGPR